MIIFNKAFWQKKIPDSPQIQLFSLLFLAATVIFSGIEFKTLHSVDGIIYAEMGKELSLRSFLTWGRLTWLDNPYFEHPHLTFWWVGLFMKIFGVSTLTSVLPIALISFFTVYLTYLLGKILVDHRFGLLAALALALTPQFLKNGRNPMLEPMLMFTIALAIYVHLRFLKNNKFSTWWLTGLCLGLAFLAKGLPALIAPVVIIAFQLYLHFVPHQNFPPLSWKRFWAYFSLALVLALILCTLVDIW
ncbi:MAG: glycosyltransferase family 39 protein, partial [Pseudomonadota bacterium]